MGCFSSKPLGEAEKILGKPLEHFNKLYSPGKVLGEGKFGKTYMCKEISTGENFTCKSIIKTRLRSKEAKEAVKTEISIMNHVSGHPNIVQMKGVYEDKECIHMVMELCDGGELSSRIEANSYYSESDAAAIVKSIVNALQFCHSKGVLHRGVNPDSFLFSSVDEDAVLKAIRFGSSVYNKQGRKAKGKMGGKYYVAPEVLQGKRYGYEVDIWSAGVILYILLCGKPPFQTDEIRKGTFDLESQPWLPCISTSAKDLIRKMLTKDPKKRISASKVLEHPWMIQTEAPNMHVDSVVLLSLKRFGAMNTLKKLALKVIAEGLAVEGMKGLKTMFEEMDTDRSGSITYGELRTGLNKLGSKVSVNEAKQLMEAADVDGNGRIDRDEFIAATMPRHIMVGDENLNKAFRCFDKDGDGYIGEDDLDTAMMKHGVRAEPNAKQIISEVDKYNDGRIHYEEFSAMMRNCNLQPQGKLLEVCCS